MHKQNFEMPFGCSRKFPPFDVTVLNDSNVSVNTPGKLENSDVKMNPSFSGDSRNPSDISTSPVHIIAAKDENKHAAVLCARKIGGVYGTTVFNVLLYQPTIVLPKL